MSTAAAVVLFVGVIGVRHVRRRRLRRRVLGPRRRRRRPRRASARGDRPLDRPGVGGQPRLADLLLRRAVDRLPRGVRVDHAHAVRAAHARRARASCCGDRASRSARRCSAPATGGTSAPPSPSRRCSCRTAWARSPGRSPRAGCPPGAWPATRGTAGSTRRRSSAASLAVVVAAYLAAVYLVWDARRLADAEMVDVLPPPRRRRRGRRRRRRVRRHLRAARRRPLPVRRPDVPRTALRAIAAVAGAASLSGVAPGVADGGADPRDGGRRLRRAGVGCGAVGLHAPRDA